MIIFSTNDSSAERSRCRGKYQKIDGNDCFNVLLENELDIVLCSSITKGKGFTIEYLSSKYSLKSSLSGLFFKQVDNDPESYEIRPFFNNLSFVEKWRIYNISIEKK